MVDFDGYSRKEPQRVLLDVTTECIELRRSPPMFYNWSQYETFFKLIARYTQQISDAISLWKGHHERCEVRRKEYIEKRLRSARPRYLPEIYHQPWQQFLSSDAPAMPVRWMSGPGVVSRQVVPNAGVRIAETWEREVRAIWDWLDLVCSHHLAINNVSLTYLLQLGPRRTFTVQIST